MGLGIILPGRTVEYRCGCGMEFYDKGLGIKHAVRCAVEHQDEVEAASEMRKQLTTPLDPEAWAWGRKRVAEGKVGFRRGRAA